ncbi:hypothetical protein AAFF_G00304770 [Aldrovandia affinis]|uniref:Uncharacterized protein n=1 Tax=Aldrovandia affinis TaxID=143900 RepID=A0AAD7SPE1_9TELE|nr:hypothetical protein AAFF_G00304770 [Aldrovandia affinis]
MKFLVAGRRGGWQRGLTRDTFERVEGEARVMERGSEGGLRRSPFSHTEARRAAAGNDTAKTAATRRHNQSEPCAVTPITRGFCDCAHTRRAAPINTQGPVAWPGFPLAQDGLLGEITAVNRRDVHIVQSEMLETSGAGAILKDALMDKRNDIQCVE